MDYSRFVFLVSALCLALGYARMLDTPQNAQSWYSWKEKFGKKYGSVSEDENRFRIWQDNLAKVYEHNIAFEKGEKTFKLGMNKFADKTAEEFREERMGPRSSPQRDESLVYESVGASVPDSQDWRTKGYVTKVQDQGSNCVSSWAWSCTGGMEGLTYNRTGILYNLSEQQLLDCTRNNTGCTSGSVNVGYDYLIKYGGAEAEFCYRYQNGKLALCTDTQCNVVANITSYRYTTFGDENALKEASGLIGPISVTVDAGVTSFQLYESGVYYEPSCTQVLLSHSMLVVGYGNDTQAIDTQPIGSQTFDTQAAGNSTGGAYWIVKNSWGTDWGLDGYIWMARNRDNNCGIASQALFPLA